MWLHAILYNVSGVQADLELKIVNSASELYKELIIQNIQLSTVSIIMWDLKFGHWISNVVISCISLYCFSGVEISW